MDQNILVSICCVTYNHQQYITHAIDGFLMQKTTFPVEIIICDDASTDGTTEIIKEYEKKYPDLIHGVYQTENQYSKGLLPYPNFAWPLAKGKYIALCEGDDYWNDPLKLQKQVDYLEQYPDYIACAHESIIRYDESYHTDDIKCSIAKLPYSDNKHIVTDYSFQEVLNTVLFQSSTLVLKNVVFDFPNDCRNSQLWDVALFLFLGGKGKIHFMDEDMSIYRKHPQALTQYGETWRNRISFSKNMIVVLKGINSYFNFRYIDIISKKEVDYYLELWSEYKKQGKKQKSSIYYKHASELKVGHFLLWEKSVIIIWNNFKYRCFNFHSKARHTIRQKIKKILISLRLFNE